MCTSYESTEYDKFDAFSTFSRPTFEYRREIYKDYLVYRLGSSGHGFATQAASFRVAA